MRIFDKYQRAGRIARPLLRAAPAVTLTLSARRRSRQPLTLDNGEEAALSIERGVVLHDGDVLVAQDGGFAVVKAADEAVTRVTAATPRQLARAAYHLGNRHVLLEVGEGYLQLEYDSVLVDMLQRLGGLRVAQVHAPFEPESGAYGGGHRHGHDETFGEDYALAQAAYRAHEPGRASTHGHDDHAHGHTHNHDCKHNHPPRPAHTHDCGHNHDHGGNHSHGHDHSHDHDHDHDHNHDHDHEHDPPHGHGKKAPRS